MTPTAHRLTSAVVASEEALRALLGEPNEVVKRKVIPRLTALTRRFIESAPFACLATASAEGRCDVSPRGDPAGFVRILDDQTLLVPDRPGNRLADSLRNILQNPQVGLLFLIPGITDSFRVNGRATIITDAALLSGSTVEGKPPKLGILVDIEEAYTQCSKALLRSELWNPARHAPQSAVPTSGEVHASLSSGTLEARQYDEDREQRYARREGFY